MSNLGSSVPRDIAHVFASRIARKWAGVVLIVSALAVAFGVTPALYEQLGASGRTWWGCGLPGCDSSSSARVAYAFLHTWPIALLIYVLIYAASRRRIGSRVASLNVPALAARAIAESEERSSMSLLAAGLALMVPLTLHYLSWVLFQQVAHVNLGAHDFGEWLLLVGRRAGYVHVLAAVSAAYYASKLERTSGNMLFAHRDRGAAKVWLIATSSALWIGPGAVLLAGISAAAILPIFWWIRRRLASERALLEKASIPSEDTDPQAAFDWLLGVIDAEGAVQDSARVIALNALADRFNIAHVAPILDRLIASSSDRIAIAVLEIAADHRHPLPIRHVLDRLNLRAPPRPKSDELAIYEAAAKLLRFYPNDPRVEAALFRLLRAPQTAAIEAARSLGYVGTTLAVEALRRADRHYGGVGFRRVARESTLRIQDRLGYLDRGRLSLVDGDAIPGALSIGDDPGRLSMIKASASLERPG